MITRKQFYDKITKFVPDWWFVKIRWAAAVFQAQSAVYSQITQDADDQQSQTFITQSDTPYIDALAEERGKERLPNESLAHYRSRVQQITSQTDGPDILAKVDELLINPGAKMYEAPLGNLYANRGCFANRDQYMESYFQNFFLIVVPSQIHAPYSFAFDGAEGDTSFGAYAGSSFAGSDVQTLSIFANIIKMIDDQKALGMMYSIIESNKTKVV